MCDHVSNSESMSTVLPYIHVHCCTLVDCLWKCKERSAHEFHFREVAHTCSCKAVLMDKRIQLYTDVLLLKCTQA